MDEKDIPCTYAGCDNDIVGYVRAGILAIGFCEDHKEEVLEEAGEENQVIEL